MLAQLEPSYIRSDPLKAVVRLVSYALFEGRPLTTKGRLINHLVFLLFEIQKRLPRLKRVEKPVFIIGTGRSGSTILGIVLSMHRDIAFLNEPKALWHAIYPNEDLIGSYTRNPAQYLLKAKDAVPEVVENAHRLFGTYLAATFSKRVLDKYPELIFRIPFVREIFPDAKFLFLVRNGWDTCLSIKKWSERLGRRQEHEMHNWWGADNRKWNLLLEQVVSSDAAFTDIISEVRQFNHHEDFAAVEWITTMREGMRLLQKYPECIHMVRFENLAANPRRTLSEILKFCDLDNDESMMNYALATLSEVPPRNPIEINEVIKPLFLEMMKSFGYL